MCDGHHISNKVAGKIDVKSINRRANEFLAKILNNYLEKGQRNTTLTAPACGYIQKQYQCAFNRLA